MQYRLRLGLDRSSFSKDCVRKWFLTLYTSILHHHCNDSSDFFLIFKTQWIAIVVLEGEEMVPTAIVVLEEVEMVPTAIVVLKEAEMVPIADDMTGHGIPGRGRHDVRYFPLRTNAGLLLMSSTLSFGFQSRT